MNREARRHLVSAERALAQGEDYYRQAADEIQAAMEADPTLGYRQVGKELGKSDNWVRQLVLWRTSATPASTPFARQEGDWRDASATRKTLREAEPEQIADMLDEPEVRENVARAQAIAAQRLGELPDDLATRVRDESMDIDEAESVATEREERIAVFVDRLRKSLDFLARMAGYPVPMEVVQALTEEERELLDAVLLAITERRSSHDAGATAA